MRAPRGFSFIELIIVVLIIGILIAMTIPGLRESALRKQIKEGFPLADLAKRGVQGFYAIKGEMAANNDVAGIPPPDKIVGQFNTAVTVNQGAITLTYGNNAGEFIKGKKVTFRPAIVPGYPQVPISWICHEVAVPDKMELRGVNETNIPTEFLPVECRGTKKK